MLTKIRKAQYKSKLKTAMNSKLYYVKLTKQKKGFLLNVYCILDKHSSKPLYSF